MKKIDKQLLTVFNLLSDRVFIFIFYFITNERLISLFISYIFYNERISENSNFENLEMDHHIHTYTLS
jgi:hypothetical protein